VICVSDKTAISPSRFKVYQNVLGQVYASGVGARVLWDTKLFDGLDELDLATSTFTPKRAGYYLLETQLWLAAVWGVYAQQIGILILPAAPLSWDYTEVRDGQPHILRCSTVEYLTPNDVVEVYAGQASGANTTVLLGREITFFDAHRLS